MGYGLVSTQRNNTRKFPKMPGPRPDHAEAKRAEAAERNKEWASLSPQAQVEDLDSRLGRGVGAKRQRARIAERAKPAPEKLIAAKKVKK